MPRAIYIYISSSYIRVVHTVLILDFDFLYFIHKTYNLVSGVIMIILNLYSG